jgi:DNA-binding NtrC family response regulator
MSVLEELRRVEQQVLARLRELRPLVGEYEQLRQVAERLGLQVDDSQDGDATKPPGASRQAGATKRSSSAKRPSAGRATARRASRSTAAGSSRPPARVDRDADVLRVVQERPGVTVREVAEALGVDASGLYRPVRRLQERGRISKDGVRLRPAEQAAQGGGQQDPVAGAAEQEHADAPTE